MKAQMKVLVIDDEEIIREELKELIEEYGFEAEAAENGEKGLELFNKYNFDIVITDLKMPGIDGIEVLNRVLRKRPETFTVMITAYATVESAIEAMKLGAYDYIKKPFKSRQLKTILKNISDDTSFKKNIMDMKRRSFKKTTDCLDIFADLVKDKPGLCITKDHPAILRKNYDMESVQMIWLCEEEDPDEFCIKPQNLNKIKEAVDIFLEKNDDSVILINGIEVLINTHSWEIVENFMTKVSDSLNKKNSRLIISADPEQLDDETLAGLQHLVGNTYVQMISDSLSNPIRRGIIRFLSDYEYSNFTTILKGLNINDSPKLSFHLRKLISEGIIEREKEVYRLKERGQTAIEALDILEQRGIDDAQNMMLLIYDKGGHGEYVEGSGDKRCDVKKKKRK